MSRLNVTLASNNAKKLSELQVLLAGLPLHLVPQPVLGVSEAEEPHLTFIENALAKARHAAQATGGAAIADDSGLCVDVLGGAPGVVSAHFAGVLAREGLDRESLRRRQDEANNQHLLEVLSGHADRRARFVCTLVAIRHAQDPEPVVAVGQWEGLILAQPQGTAGFGYDPLMFIPDLQCTVAELDPERKNLHSHRALAAARLGELLRQAWRLEDDTASA